MTKVLGVAIEGLFVPKRDGKIKVNEQMVLAESAGVIRAAIYAALQSQGLDLSTIELTRPPAWKWRPQNAGIPAKTPKGKAEAMAIDRAEKYLGLVFSGKLTKAERGAIAEAAWMAKHAQTAARYRQQRGGKTSISVGIDPGVSGGWCVLHGAKPLAYGVWSKLPKTKTKDARWRVRRFQSVALFTTLVGSQPPGADGGLAEMEAATVEAAIFYSVYRAIDLAVALA